MDMLTPFEKTVDEHGAAILRVCRSMLGTGPDADDAWSETFPAALRAWPTLPDSTNVEAWLVRVAQRKSIDIIRARARAAVPTDPLPETVLGFESDSTRVWDEVAALPPAQRHAVAYHYFAGLPHAETAELLGSTSQAVRRASADGIRNLRRALLSDSRKEDR